MSGWIKASERLPDQIEDVIIAYQNYGGEWEVGLGWLNPDNEWRLTQFMLYSPKQVSHWQPLPDLPTDLEK